MALIMLNAHQSRRSEDNMEEDQDLPAENSSAWSGKERNDVLRS